MQYGYVKAIKDISVTNQIDTLISHGVDKKHIYTSLDDIPTKPDDTILICRLDVLGMTFGQLHRYFIDLDFRRIKLLSVLDEGNSFDMTFMKIFNTLHNNEVNVRAALCLRSREKAIALGKNPGAKRVIGEEQEKRIHELLEKGFSFKEIYESIGVTRNTFYLWRKRQNVIDDNLKETKS